MSIRYSFGGDEHVFVEVDEEMSLQAFFTSLSMTNAVRESRIAGRHRDLPGQRLLPDQVRSRPDQPGRHAGGAEEPGGLGPEFRRDAEDADHRGAGLLPRPVDDGDADALPRAPSGPEGDRHRICGAHQQFRLRRGFHHGAFRLALVRLHGGLRRRACRSSTRWSTGLGRSRCPNISGRAPTRRS